MKKALLVLVLTIAASIQASATVLKSVRCEGATMVMEVVVDMAKRADPQAPTVTWEVEDSETGARARFQGYLYSENGLKEFSSTDLESDLEISGSVASLTFGSKEETLLCR